MKKVSTSLFVLIIISFFAVTSLRGECRISKEIQNHLLSFNIKSEITSRLCPIDIYKPLVICDAPTNESTVIRINTGHLKIFYVNNPGDADKIMSVTSENGIEWNKPKKELDLPGKAYYANQVIQDMEGSFHCVFHIRGEGKNGYNGRHYNLWHTRKINEETGWETPKEIFNGYVGSIRSLFQLYSGRLLMSYGKAVPERVKKSQSNTVYYGWNEVMVLYSDDNGDKWQAAKNTLNIEIDPDKTTRYGAVEPVIVQMKNDGLWMLIRTNKGMLYESFSYDSGESWSDPEPSRFISSDSPAHFLRLQDGRLLIFFSMNQRYDDPNSYAFGGREVLHAAISEDDGNSWKGFREVLKAEDEKGEIRSDRGTAYPSATETCDGKILLVSGQGVSKSIVMFDPDWLLEDNISENSFTEHEQWTTYGLSDIISKEYSEKDQVIRFLAGSKPDSRQKQEVVRNFPALTSGEMRMEVEFINDCPELSLSFTDHFSISGDSVASENSVFRFAIPNVYMKAERIPVRIRWNSEKQIADIYIFNKKVSEARFKRVPEFGINYLRAGIPASVDNVKWGFSLSSGSVR